MKKTAVEPIVGRYTTVSIMGEDCRIYFEEAGQGIPFLCVPTAGSDTRQFRHMMCDEDITKKFRVVTFDMPWHGKSYPPVGWEKREYKLSGELFMQTIRSVSAALGLDHPVFMGCSIGGRITLQLANFYGKEFRALIGLEAADYQTTWYDRKWLHRSDVHGGEVSAAIVSGLLSPVSPEEYRQQTLWQYMQSGPGVFGGDLYYYHVDSDIRGKLGGINTKACPLYLLTGEYDYSCRPEDTLRTAKSIPGAKAKVMKGIGHFPMSENPAQFKKYIMPVLNDIVRREKKSS